VLHVLFWRKYTVTGKQIIKRLQQEGWTIRRIKGSHHIMAKGLRMISVPVHGNKDLGKRIIHEISKVAGWL